MEKALSGIRVVEWCELVAGPYCSKLMADMGAEVLKVEPPQGDEARRRKSGLFLYLNTSKLGLTLDVGKAEGKGIFLELVKKADVLVADKPLALLEKLGLTYESLQTLNPRLIMTSITPFGLAGPYREYKAYPLNTWMAGGEGFMTPAVYRDLPAGGDESAAAPEMAFMERPPVKIGQFAGEYMTGIISAAGTLMALHAREVWGKGQLVDISQQQALIYLNPIEIHTYSRYGRIPSRVTRIFRFAGRFRCKDGYVEFCPQRPEHWARFRQLMGGFWNEDDKFKEQAYFDGHYRELRPLAEQTLMNFTRAELYRRAQELKVPLAPFYHLDEVMESPQMVSRQFFAELENPQAGRCRYPSAPYQLFQTPWQASRPAPLLGADNETVYDQLLGFGREKLAGLREKGVI